METQNVEPPNLAEPPEELQEETSSRWKDVAERLNQEGYLAGRLAEVRRLLAESRISL